MILLRLLGLIKPLIKYMILAVLLGLLGHVSAFLLPVLGLYLFTVEFNRGVLILLITCGILRGFFRYGEQYLNHYIAFKILARLRSLVFAKLRTLGEHVNRGSLVTLVSSDIELLEVFFAHTISPIMIAILMNTTIVIVLSYLSPFFGVVATIAYIVLALVVPFLFGKAGTVAGQNYRNGVSNLNTHSLEGIQGIKELKDFGLESEFILSLETQGRELANEQAKMKRLAGLNRIICDAVVLLSSLAIVLIGQSQNLPLNTVMFGFVMLISSFGPIIALSQLTNNLYLTRASAKRVLTLLETKGQMQAIVSNEELAFDTVAFESVSFAYDKDLVLDNVSFSINPGTVVGIRGASGSGKSTILKLLMRLYEPNSGFIKIGGRALNTVDSLDLKNLESIMFQSSDIFHDTLYNNILLARKDASEDEVVRAMTQAGLSDFIENRHSLIVQSMGANLSSGECQRIGLARVFLHGGSLILLDEPTANLDALNEAMILHALNQYQLGRTIVIVSHRESTLRFADTIYDMEDLLR